MKTILAFAGSNSSTSINYKLIKHTVSQIKGYKTQVLNMSEMIFPMYSEDEEKNLGFIKILQDLCGTIKESDGLIISVNEHNGNPSAYFKNVIDWLSRFDRKFLIDKKVFLMSTSPGGRGGQNSLNVTKNLLPYFGAEITTTFSLPSFGENFSIEKEEIVSADLKKEHLLMLNDFLSQL